MTVLEFLGAVVGAAISSFVVTSVVLWVTKDNRR